MRKVKVLTACLAAVLAAGTGVVLTPPTIESVTVGTAAVEYAEEMTVTTAASIETTAAETTTTTTTSATTTTEETTTTTEETTTTAEAETAAPETAPAEPAPPVTEAPAPAETAAPETLPETETQPQETVLLAAPAEAQVTEAIPAETQPIVTTTAPSKAITVTPAEYIMLCNVVGHEYGAYWVPEYDKALVVEVIMNRVNSPLFPNTIYGVLTQRNQFSGLSYYINLGTFSNQVTDSVKAAVDLYLSDPTQFNHGYLFFSGDGRRNYFRTRA